MKNSKHIAWMQKRERGDWVREREREEWKGAKKWSMLIRQPLCEKPKGCEMLWMGLSDASRCWQRAHRAVNQIGVSTAKLIYVFTSVLADYSYALCADCNVRLHQGPASCWLSLAPIMQKSSNVRRMAQTTNQMQLCSGNTSAAAAAAIVATRKLFKSLPRLYNCQLLNRSAMPTQAPPLTTSLMSCDAQSMSLLPPVFGLRA